MSDFLVVTEETIARLSTEQGIHDLFVAGGWIPPTWLPIASAPRDGTPVLVAVRYTSFTPTPNGRIPNHVWTQTTAKWVERDLPAGGEWRLCDPGDYAEASDVNPLYYKPLGPDPEPGT